MKPTLLSGPLDESTLGTSMDLDILTAGWWSGYWKNPCSGGAHVPMGRGTLLFWGWLISGTEITRHLALWR